jgi:hypothetical protein
MPVCRLGHRAVRVRERISLADVSIHDEQTGPRRAPALFLLLITISGLAALIYQVAWTRRLSLVLGVST